MLNEIKFEHWKNHVIQKDITWLPDGTKLEEIPLEQFFFQQQKITALEKQNKAFREALEKGRLYFTGLKADIRVCSIAQANQYGDEFLDALDDIKEKYPEVKNEL